jgi:hypothetical protein
MMVPVGRITMVRTFAKSELIRAMSFVAILSAVGQSVPPAVESKCTTFEGENGSI